MKISIITIVYNRQYCIADCIRSVLNQTYDNIEHVVIDGGSTDGTLAQIAPFRSKLGFFLSEKDEGLFDALNKGIKNSTGDVIGVLHSDDFFYGPDTLQQVADAFQSSGADLVYAKGMFVDRNDASRVMRIYPSKPYKRHYLSFGWIPLHTTIYVKRALFEQYGVYNRDYAIAGDYEISLRWFQNDAIKKYFLDRWVVKMRLGGVSTSGNLQMQKSMEDLRIINRYKLPGKFTLACKIGRKIPQYLIPQLKEYKIVP